MLEMRGLPTVVVALVLPQVEKSRPPRALMVPFVLGRPLGEPGDGGFQRRVLTQALQLLDREDGPVILEHFADDNPNWFDTPDWVAPATVSGVGFAAELLGLLPVWLRFQARFGRSSVGLSGLPPADWPGFLASVMAGGLPTLPLHPTAALAVRFLLDDVKAFYAEVAQADGAPPSARQIDAWFWQRTEAGQTLIALRALALASTDNGLKTVATRFFVPGWFVPK